MTTPSAPRSKLPVITALGTAQTLAFGSTLYLPAILADPMAAELGIPTGWAFGAFSLALIFAALFGPSAGARIDRFGGRNVLAISSIVFATGLALLGLSDSLIMMCLAWMVIGIGMSMGLYESAFATLTWLFGHEARGPITGITLIAGFASTICWPASTGLEAEFGWRVTCYFWAALHIVLGLPLNLFFIPRRKHTDSGEKSPDTDTDTNPPTRHGASPRTIAHAPPAKLGRADIVNLPMILLALVFAASWFTATAMAAHLPRLLQISGMDTANAVIAASLVGPAQVAGRLVEFGFLKKMHPLLSARLSAMTHPIGAILLLVFGSTAGMVFTTMHGVGNGILTIAKGTLPLAIFGPAGYGMRQGIVMAPSRFAQAGAPFLFGLLIDHNGNQALLLTIGLGILSCGALLFLHRPAVPSANQTATS